ncbi:MAG: hypothetical protein ACPHE2_03045, partial [Candidatus Puniceispirillaceae bacterium]
MSGNLFCRDKSLHVEGGVGHSVVCRGQPLFKAGLTEHVTCGIADSAHALEQKLALRHLFTGFVLLQDKGRLVQGPIIEYAR